MLKPKNDKKNSPRHKENLTFILAVLLLAIVLVATYIGMQPKKYKLQIGDTSNVDISAPKTFVDKKATELRAKQAVSDIAPVYMRSEDKAKHTEQNFKNFKEIVQKHHKNMQALLKSTTVNKPETEAEIKKTNTAFSAELSTKAGIVLTTDTADFLLRLSDAKLTGAFRYFQDKVQYFSLMTLDVATKSAELQKNREQLTKEQNASVAQAYIEVLDAIVLANLEYNEDATESAKAAAYQKVIDDPVMIARGTRIINQGEIVTPVIYDILQELNLTDEPNFDYRELGVLFLYIFFIFFITYLFLSRFNHTIIDEPRQFSAIAATLIFTQIISAYLCRIFPLATPVYFAAVIISTYFGFRMAMVFSLDVVLLTAPLVGFSAQYVIIAMIGSFVAALITRGIKRQDNYAKIIIMTTVINVASAVLIGLMEKETLGNITAMIIETGASALISVVIAIGIMPLYEMLFNTVSPLTLIDLSQPGHPLLKRLFVEAPGTSQHSIMVANLADSASEAIGANAMLARVGAYFHDVGKLVNPIMFTENQTGENPHDKLTPEESTKIITKHPEDSLLIGRKYHLPEPILKIGNEHHGTTVLQYFYHEACELAEKNGQSKPSIELYRYRTPIPSSRESGVVMLADTTEAAMRSAKIHNVEEAEKLIRKLVRDKIDQDQLKDSGLSFADIEKIIRAFLHVYAGQFHERISYPNANKLDE